MVWTVLNDNGDKTLLPLYLKDLYSREPHQVDSLLSTLINPRDSKRLDVDKCLWVICGGQKPEDFTRIIKANDRSVICGLVWDANFIAYRCKTCGIAPCMSLCADCFENGEHDGHDFNMFKSGAGGACDCGNHEVMKSQGFCSRHGPKASKNAKTVPDDVTLMVRLVVPKLINFLICKMEHAIAENHGKVDKGDEEAAKLLLQLCEMGDVTRRIVAEAMLQPVGPEYSRTRSKSDSTPFLRRQSSTDSTTADLQGLAGESVTDSILSSLPGPSKELTLDTPAGLDSRTVMEKMIDLLIELKFSQFLVTLMLSMLQEAVYKQEFMKSFCMRYSKIANLLTHRFEGDEDQRLCNRLVHASVQLFSNEHLTLNMVENNGLLGIVVSALSDLISRTLTKVDWDCEDDSVNSKSLFVVNCDHEIIRHHRYWPVVSDFHNLLSHEKIARFFLGEAALIRRWMGILTHFTGMNKNKRQLIVHVPYENLTSQHAYSAEIETSSHIMTNLLCVCTSPHESDQIRLVLSECVRALRSWFRMIQVQLVKPFLAPLNGEEFTATGPVPRQEITFHLPLHRYLAGFISQAVNYCGMSLEEVLPSEDILWCVLEHVLRIQIGIGEILSGLWVRNGYMLRSQEEFYLQGQYCNQCVDLDIFLLQVCVMGLDSDHFMTTLIQRYGLESWFRFGELVSTKPAEDAEIQQGLVESMLNLLLQLVYQRMYMGLSEESMVHLELVTKLTMGDFTHSQLTDNLPDKPGMSELTELFDEVLSKVSDYKQPTNDSGTLTQGIYALKPALWKSDFQPLHVMLRGSYKRGYQLAMDKYKGWYQSHIKRKVQGLWPPFRAPLPLNAQFTPLYRLLRSRTLHAVLFTVLYKALHEKDTVNDNMVYLTFYLADLALDTATEELHTPNLDQGCIKPDITVAELEDGNVPQAIIKCIRFLEQTRAFAIVDPFKEKASDPKVTELCRKLISSPYTFTVSGKQYSTEDVSSALLLLCNHRLQPPLFGWLLSAAKQLNQGTGHIHIGKKSDVHHYQQILEQLPPHRYKMIEMLLHYLSTLVEEKVATLSDVCTVYLPYNPPAFATIVSYYDWVFRVRTPTEEGYSPAGVFEINYKSDSIAKNANQSVMGTSLVQCMYEMRKRLSVIDCSASPSTSNTSTSHNGVEAITSVLEKLCALDPNNAKLLRSLERADASTPDRGSSPCSSSEAKRKRAKERQAKLLQAFASKQRIFEAQMEAVDELLPEVGPEVRGPAKGDRLFSCIICGMDSPHSEDAPIATLVFCQPSSILLHATAPSVDRAIMDEGLESVPTLQSTTTEHYLALSSLYSSGSAWRTVGQRTQPGLHVQSCSHTVHVGCFKAYSDSQPQTDNPTDRSLVWGKELSCPTCRRLSNTILPLPCTPFFTPYTRTEVTVPVSPATQIPLPFVHNCTDKGFAPSHPLSCLGCEAQKLSLKIQQMVKTGKVDAVKGAIAQAAPTAWESAVESFVSSLESYYTAFVEQKSLSTNEIITLSLHYTLQCELLERNHSLRENGECTRKYCTGRLVSALAGHATQNGPVVSVFPTLQQLLDLLAREEGEGSSGGGGDTKTVSLVMQEPSWILLKIVLFSKITTTWESYVTVVRLLLVLQSVRSFIAVASRFSRDEQNAWSRRSGDSDFEALLSAICSLLYWVKAHTAHKEMDITGYVWTNQSIEANIQELTLPLLREAALLGHHMFGRPLPRCAGPCELTSICQWFGFTASAHTGAAAAPTTIIESLRLPTEKLLSIGRKLIAQIPMTAPLTPLLPLVRSWARPRLLNLPRIYGKLYFHYRHVKCNVCKSVPQDPAICLICGSLVCVRSQCCLWMQTGECTKHAQQCGTGTAIYLVIMSSTVVIIRGERVYLWGSVYLDQHDEEDIDLKRGKTLYLSDTRYQCLNQQWVSHSFDHTLKRWGWHQSQF